MNNRKLYFCYELAHNGWSPVIYHNDKPATTSANGQTVQRSTLYNVTAEFLDESGEPSFFKLMNSFPPPEK